MTGPCSSEWNEWIYLVDSRLGVAVLSGWYCSTCDNIDIISTEVLPSVAHTNRNSPALYLAELRVGHVNEQGQARHPYTHLELSAQKTVGEVEHHPALSSCLLPINIHIVTSL